MDINTKGNLNNNNSYFVKNLECEVIWFLLLFIIGKDCILNHDKTLVIEKLPNIKGRNPMHNV